MGQSGRYARVRASEAALQKLDGLAPFEFRARYRCDCTQEGSDDEVSVDKGAMAKEALGPGI
jgi:endoribonuclease Dicer